jgi:hypothetical protein
MRRVFKPPPDMSPVSLWLAGLVGISAIAGLLLLAAYALEEGSLEVFAVGALVALAATAAGAVGGFLFGLPRYNPVLELTSSFSNDSASSSSAPADPARIPSAVYTPSNNLEQISDWLTKLLIGAGLVQLGRMGSWFGGFIDGLAGAMHRGDLQIVSPAAKVVSGSLLIFYTTFGFMGGYIITNLWYRRRLEKLISRSFKKTGTSGQ